MASIVKTGSGFKAVVRISGYPASCKTFNSKTAAAIWARKEEDLIRGGERVARDAARRTMADAIAAYGTYLSTVKRPKTEASMLRQLARWGERIGRLAVHRVTPATISRQKDAMLEAGLSGASVNRELAVLSGLFQWASSAERAERWGARSNPVRQVAKLREPRGRVRFLDDGERVRLLAACREQTGCPALAPLVTVAIYTGMRQGELMNLTWADLDLVQGFASLEETKNDTRRRVPVRGPALEALRDWQLKTGARFRPDGRVFGLGWFPGRYWTRAVEAAGIEDFRFHDCRHTAASYLRQVGVSLETIADVLGHKTLAMTRRYAHLGADDLGDAVDRMAERFGHGC